MKCARLTIGWLLVGFTFCLSLVGAAPASQSAAPTAPLFLPVSDHERIGVIDLPPLDGTQRTQIMRIDRQGFSRWTSGDTALALNLFDDVRYPASALRPEPQITATGSRIWVGELDGVAFSNVVLLVAPTGEIELRILTPGVNYTVQPLGGDLYRVSEINTYVQRVSRNGFDDAVRFQPDPVQAAQVQERISSPRADSGHVIDVMVVYTPKAAAFFGGQSFIQMAIENTVALTNKSYQNSAVNFRMRLVHTAQVNYVEQPFQDLNRLADPSDGFMDEIHALRDQYAADLVMLIPGTSAEQRAYCGIAFLPTSLPAPDAAFAVTEALCISDITFAHEFGHTMGKAHDRANAGAAVHAYAYGYQDPADPPGADWGDFVTLMAYSDGGECPPVFQPGVCPAIAWWSNPSQTFNGKPIGSASENNVLSLNQTAQLIANYRVSADGSPTATPSPAASLTTSPFPTITAPSTPAAAREWVLNGGFEIDADSDRIPDGWHAVNARQKCKDLNCYAVLKGKDSRPAKLKQTLSYNQPVSGTLSASVTLTGKNLVKQGKVVIKVLYMGVEPTERKLVFAIPEGTTPTATLVQHLPISGTLQSLKVVAKYGGISGKMLVDDVSVTLLP